MKNLLRRVPALVTAHRHLRYLGLIAWDRWCGNRQQRLDRSHLLRQWDFESPAEQERHDIIFSAVERHVPDLTGARVLEVGCSDGVFTARLARSGALVTACDISPVALEMASRRCRPFESVVFQKLDIARDALPGRYDIVFAMDVLEYLHGRARLRAVIRKLADAVHPQGLLAFSECRIAPELRNAWWLHWLPEGGDAIGRLVAAEQGLSLVHSEVHPGLGVRLEGYIDHVIAVFRKIEQAQTTGDAA